MFLNAHPTIEEDADELPLLNRSRHSHAQSARRHQFSTAPLFTRAAFGVDPTLFPHRGLLGSVLEQHRQGQVHIPRDPRLYVNTRAPWSAVVCGVQGSGKSHTVSCLLESSLIQDKQIGTQPEPLAAVVFHFDEEDGGRPCEAAYLSMPIPNTPTGAVVQDVTVLVSPNNLNNMTKVYESLPNVRVRPLYLKESHLNATRMLSMMGCDDLTGLPLYMITALSILRDMGADHFTYSDFKLRLEEPSFNAAQKAGLELRLSLLDSYIDDSADDVLSFFGKGKLVIVDLSDPFLDSGNAALLFNLLLGLFVKWETTVGKVLVLDEAHKYLQHSHSAGLTKSISSLIRQQRHRGMRVIVSTQEPTVVPSSILDLTSFIICHKFSSPAWCSHLKSHFSMGEHPSSDNTPPWVERVMQLETGQALVISSSALCIDDTPHSTESSLQSLAVGYLVIHTRSRITLDGGASIMSGDDAHASDRLVETPGTFDQDPSGPVTGSSVLPPDFRPLITTLFSLRAEGIEQPSPVLVLRRLTSDFEDLSAATGADNFTAYIAAAQSSGLVKLSNDSKWGFGSIRLRPQPPAKVIGLPSPIRDGDLTAPAVPHPRVDPLVALPVNSSLPTGIQHSSPDKPPGSPPSSSTSSDGDSSTGLDDDSSASSSEPIKAMRQQGFATVLTSHTLTKTHAEDLSARGLSQFGPLVEVMQSIRVQGYERPGIALVRQQLASLYPTASKDAGFADPEQYLASAESKGLVEMGAWSGSLSKSSRWIRLAMESASQPGTQPPTLPTSATPVQQKVPLPQYTPVHQKIPLPQPTPIQQNAPLPQPTPVQQKVPLPQPTPVQQNLPLPQPTPVHQRVPLPQPALSPQANTSSTSNSPAPKPLPPRFADLVNILAQESTRISSPKINLTRVMILLNAQNPRYLAGFGFTRWTEFWQAAVASGLVFRDTSPPGTMGLLPSIKPFLPLIKILQREHSITTSDTILQSNAAEKLKAEGGGVYIGYNGWKELVTAAKSSGVVDFGEGAMAGRDWIRLNRDLRS